MPTWLLIFSRNFSTCNAPSHLRNIISLLTTSARCSPAGPHNYWTSSFSFLPPSSSTRTQLHWYLPPNPLLQMSFGSFGYPSSDEDAAHRDTSPNLSTNAKHQIAELKEVRSFCSTQADHILIVTSKVIKQNQLEIGQLKGLVLELQDKNATLEASASKGRGRKSKTEELSEGAQVKQLWKKWSLLVASWIHPSLFKQACQNIDPTQPDSFGNEEANRLRTIQELYNFVPRSFHIPLEKKSWFGDSVCIHSYYLLLEFS